METSLASFNVSHECPDIQEIRRTFLGEEWRSETSLTSFTLSHGRALSAISSSEEYRARRQRLLVSMSPTGDCLSAVDANTLSLGLEVGDRLGYFQPLPRLPKPYTTSTSTYLHLFLLRRTNRGRRQALLASTSPTDSRPPGELSWDNWEKNELGDRTG